jgi:hypothetical protein
VDKIFTLSCRSSRRALAPSPLVFAASTAFLYISRRDSSTDNTFPFVVDCTCFVAIRSSFLSVSNSPVISCNSAY